jgi:hypothetical protein
MNRAMRRMMAKKHRADSHVCQEGAHVLYSPAYGYLLAVNTSKLDFVDGLFARNHAQRFHRGCAGAFAAEVRAHMGVSLEVRHQAQAEAEGWE